jgi:phospholipid-binding lipoprotein MlaA
MRVAINSVLGIGGLIDIATPAGLPKYKEDFGQTLGVWGVPAGPYLVLPLFGPSTVRDTGGMLVDRQLDPSAYIYPVALRNSLVGVRIVAGRAQLLGATSLIEQAALDKYAFMRDAYLQRREYQIYDGNPPHKKDEEESEAAPTAAPAEGKPAEGKPAEGKPAEGKPAEGKPAEGKPAEGKPAEGKPAEEKPADGKPAEEKPADGKPAEEKPAEEKPADGKPAEEKPTEGKPADAEQESPSLPVPTNIVPPGIRFGR